MKNKKQQAMQPKADVRSQGLFIRFEATAGRLHLEEGYTISLLQEQFGVQFDA